MNNERLLLFVLAPVFVSLHWVDRSLAMCMFGLARITYSSATYQRRFRLLLLLSSSSVEISKADINMDTIGGTSFMNILHHNS